MNSIAIKQNSKELLNFINDRFLKLDLKDVILKFKTFKSYKNIIIHYLGDDNRFFLDKLSSILTDTIINFY